MSNLLVEKYEELVDDKVGLICFVEEMESFPDFPRFHHCAGIASDISAFTPHENSLPSGGAATTREAAIAKTIGEAIERYCSALYEVSQYPLTSAANATFPHIAPEEFATNNAKEIERINSPWEPFTQETVTRWAPMQNISENCEVYVPAVYVHVPYYYYVDEGDTPIIQPISTGLACHSSIEMACISAICEVIERDAFTCMWQAKMSLPHIDASSLPSELRDIYDRFNVPGGKITLLLSLQDHGIPTVISVYQHESSAMPAFAFAAATALNPATAIRKNLEELAHTFRWIYSLKRKNPDYNPGENFANVTDQDSHLLCWSRDCMRDRADFVFASEKVVLFADIPNHEVEDQQANVRTLNELIKRVGHNILLSELTSPDVETLGLRVVRAVIPGFQPLAMGHKNRTVGSKRLLTLPQKLGYAAVDPNIGDNPLPHPFP